MRVGQSDGTTKDEVVLTGSNVPSSQAIPTRSYGDSASPIDGFNQSANSNNGRGLLTVASFGYNQAVGAYDAWRNNTQGTLLASAARTITTSSPDQINYNGRSLDVILNVTSAGTGSIALTVEGKDPVSGLYFPILSGVAVTANGMTVYMVGPGIAEAANVSTNKLIPRTFRITVTANNANPVTYSVGYALGI